MNNNKGMALLMTLLVVALLSVLVMAMSTRSLLAMMKARNSISALNASYILRSGVSGAMGVLEMDARTTAIDTLLETWAQEIRQFSVGEGTVSVQIEDEASRFNINTLVNLQGKINETAVKRFGRLLVSLGSDEGLSATAAEWLRRHRGNLYYSFRDPSELLLVPGVTRAVVGTVGDYVTVYTDRINERNINVNTVSREVLLALSSKLTVALVEGIIRHRRENPVRQIGELRRVQGMTDEILFSFSDIIDVRSSNFKVRTEARVSDVVRKGSALVRRDGAKVWIVVWKEE